MGWLVLNVNATLDGLMSDHSLFYTFVGGFVRVKASVRAHIRCGSNA